jgi:hypothetical protein
LSALLGKEDTVFMPTGTLANHIALRLLCGENRHARDTVYVSLDKRRMCGSASTSRSCAGTPITS